MYVYKPNLRERLEYVELLIENNRILNTAKEVLRFLDEESPSRPVLPRAAKKKTGAELTDADNIGISKKRWQKQNETRGTLRGLAARLRAAEQRLRVAEQEAVRRYTMHELFPAWKARGELPAADRFLHALGQASDAATEDLICKELSRFPQLRIFTDHHYMLSRLFPFLLSGGHGGSVRDLAASHAQATARPLTWSSHSLLGGENDLQDPGMYLVHDEPDPQTLVTWTAVRRNWRLAKPPFLDR